MRGVRWLGIVLWGGLAGCTGLLGDFDTASVDTAFDAGLDAAESDQASPPPPDTGTDGAHRACDPTTEKACGALCVALNDPNFGCANVATCAPCRFANAGAKCDTGACAFDACNTGFADCTGGVADGCETNIGSDAAHCGSCTNACAATGGAPNCAGGRCSALVCTPGSADCDQRTDTGCEVSLDRDVNNCGACAHACGTANATPACADGRCTFACAAGWGRCPGASADADGCNVDLRNDDKNCGACGATCGAGQHCVGGTCACDGKSCAGGCCAGTTCTAPSATACGINGGACVACAIQNAAGGCTASGTCDYKACNAGWLDVDFDRTNGCETPSPLTVPEAKGFMQLWLAADSGYDGQSAWYDQSPIGRKAICTTCPSLGKTPNGRPALVFDGKSYLTLASDFSVWDGGVTMFVVFAGDPSAADQAPLVAFGSKGTSAGLVALAHGAGGIVPAARPAPLPVGGAFFFETCDANANCAPVSSNNWVGWQRLTALDDTGKGVIFASGTSVASAAVPLPTKLARTGYIGFDPLGHLLVGQIAELLVFNVTLSDKSRKQIEQYLATKYKL